MDRRFFVFGFFAGLLLVGGMFNFKSHPRKRVVEQSQQTGTQMIQVQVGGAVANPGIYSLDADNRVMDALATAGGMLPQADLSGINLAASLYNMQKLEIPYLADVVSRTRTDNDIHVNTPVAGSELDISTQIAIPKETQITDVYPADFCPDDANGNGEFVWPADNHFLSGNDYSYSHPGIDISAGEGAPIYAADSGMIRLEGNDNSGYGNIIEIDHGNGYSTVYAHLSVIGVTAGQTVCAGQQIGTAGSTGNSTGTHLHFEIIYDGEYIDPWSVLPAP